MKTRTFEVPVDQMLDFAGILEEHNLNNTIQGPNDDDEIVVEVYYEPDDRDGVFELFELLDPEDDDD